MSTSNLTIAITGDFSLEHLKCLNNYDVTVLHLKEPKNENEIKSLLEQADIFVAGGPEYFYKHLLTSAKKLKTMIVMGTGINGFLDLRDAQELGIEVINTPAINYKAVGEMTVAAITMILANAFHAASSVTNGMLWYQKPRISLANAKIGILGLGNVAQNVIERLRQNTSKEIYYFNRTRRLDLEQKFNLKYVPLPELLKVDLCSVHITYHPETHHFLNMDDFSECNKDLVLVNFSNPKVIKPDALKKALTTGKIKRAFFDGYYREWVDNKGCQQDPEGLLALGFDKFVATSHIAAQEDSSIATILDSVDNRLNSILEQRTIPRKKYGNS